MRILIVGLGSIGQRHLQNLKRLGVNDFLTWRVRDLPLSESLPLEDLEICPSLDDALSRNPIAALICNLPSQHLPVAVQAAKAGCHLFIEKPLSHSLDGIDELVSLAREKKLITLVGFNLRFHPGLQLIGSLVQEGRIGRLLNIRAQVGQYLPDWHPWEDYAQSYSAHQELGGGVILDLIHELDYVRWLGGQVNEVACLAGHVSRLKINTEDIAEILLRFKNGAIGSVHVDYLQRCPGRTCQIIGEQGSIHWDYYTNEVQLFEARQPGWQVFRQEGFERNDMFVAEMQHFLACIDGRETSVVGVEEGARILRLALAARESSETGKRHIIFEA